MSNRAMNALGALGMAVLLGFAGIGAVSIGAANAAVSPYQQPDCQEDEGWVAVSYGTPGSFEDQHGVNRGCVPISYIEAGGLS